MLQSFELVIDSQRVAGFPCKLQSEFENKVSIRCGNEKAAFQNLENRMVTGDPGQNRTGDLPLRRRLLYPTELRNHKILSYYITNQQL